MSMNHADVIADFDALRADRDAPDADRLARLAAGIERMSRRTDPDPDGARRWELAYLEWKARGGELEALARAEAVRRANPHLADAVIIT